MKTLELRRITKVPMRPKTADIGQICSYIPYFSVAAESTDYGDCRCIVTYVPTCEAYLPVFYPTHDNPGYAVCQP